ncbi:S-layer homology domain-containing protein [Paenibacillus sp. HB172176]|uniref:S-layer homology domain-containing protein n=1 Tax=Paenibacillus sp. HB172176 TaxID=2493690 RepID=UPI00143A869C|nr:S-layer homology domain-containing protein [Paenibacillus sp. HB172176]
MKKKKPFILATLTAILLFALGQTVFAFSDTTGNSNEAKINALKDKGIVSGYGGDTFKPHDSLTYAEGITMLVKAFDLNIDNIRFIKQPLASDTFPNLADDAWYSDSFIIAPLNGIDIPKDIKATDPMPREQFAHNLFQAMMQQGDYPFIEIYALINDEDEITPGYMNSIQKLLISKIVSLDKDDNFNPKDAVTRAEAAGWLYDGMKFVDEHDPIEPAPELPAIAPTLQVESVNDDVNKVTITASMPNPGYGLRVASIVFEDEQAVINVEPVLPDPDKMYPMVITDVKIVTYVDSAFKPVLPESTDTAASTPSSSASTSNNDTSN